MIGVKVRKHHHIDLLQRDAACAQTLRQSARFRAKISGAGVDQYALRACIDEQSRIAHRNLRLNCLGRDRLGHLSIGAVREEGILGIGKVPIRKRKAAEFADANVIFRHPSAPI